MRVFDPFGRTSHRALYLLYLIGTTRSLRLQLALADDEDGDLNVALVIERLADGSHCALIYLVCSLLVVKTSFFNIKYT